MPNMANEMGGWGPAMAGAVSSAQQTFKTAGDYEQATESAKKINTEEKVAQATEALTKAAEIKTKQETVTSATQAELNNAAAASQRQGALNAAVQNSILMHDVVTAEGASRISQRTAADTEKYGTSKLGVEGAALERILNRLAKEIGAGPGPTGVPVDNQRPSARQNARPDLNTSTNKWHNKGYGYGHF